MSKQLSLYDHSRFGLDLLEQAVARRLYTETRGRTFSADDLRATLNVHTYFEDTAHDIGILFQKLLVNGFARPISHTRALEESRHLAENKVWVWTPKAEKELSK